MNARPLLRYAALWLGAGAAVAGVVALTVGGVDERTRTVTLPAIRAADLEVAARAAGCQLRRNLHVAVNPPVVGPRTAAPAVAGVFTRPVRVPALISAMRHGIIVIHYRTDLPVEQVDELRGFQATVPAGTIVTPNASGMPYAVAITAYGRLLGCARYTPRTSDAIRLFQGRYLGSGPDA